MGNCLANSTEELTTGTQQPRTIEVQASPQTGDGGKSSRVVHIVEAGENLFHLADVYQVEVKAIIAANDLGSNLVLHRGQQLNIPITKNTNQVGRQSASSGPQETVADPVTTTLHSPQRVTKPRASSRTFYAVLGVSEEATDKDLKVAFRNLSKKYVGQLFGTFPLNATVPWVCKYSASSPTTKACAESNSPGDQGLQTLGVLPNTKGLRREQQPLRP
ncbi:hypothetical protein CYMTET_8643, partial [Cymbomonas tetramitiformis]